MIPFIHTALAANATIPNTPGLSTGTAIDASGIIPTCATKPGGPDANLALDCALQLFINIADILMGMVGIILLVVIVWGGVLYLTARGDSAKVTKATKMFISSFIGLLIVFGAFSGVQYGVNVLRSGDASSVSSSEFLTCGAPPPAPVSEQLNNGKACAPGFICKAGVCCDTTDAEGECYIQQP
ncbi:hypothetical protein COV06_03310 [Candidatus Uhrbacteria bacterium CG10_big_fil_rev_8_21_14_0_10_50_16]|uniref:Uncharacterized protein n=1 Tax=Candidatus Uhrbacteria bacterium CG10_big_fil_rev_8_21_14_0_10_50_16 TaxID=1975039 RepID=A0A2H0RLW8_9BACT|nr:MAG: hypothetical protein COV06_03310 [Candidatus Uhrbacteria bacterium CG10_big_fil_rev_8_21_14_0_10_50_16]